MSSSLEKLVSNLPKESFKYTTQKFNDKKLDLISQKGVYPYDFMDFFEKFNKTELPTKGDFYSILNNEHITDKQYEHAQNVWNTFKLKSMGEYHDLYLKTDVLLLVDVFETSEKLAYNITNLTHVIISHLLVCRWDAMLKMTDI